MTVVVCGRTYASLLEARRYQEDDLRAEDIAIALAHPLYGRLRPTSGRVLTTRPHRRVSEYRTANTGLVAPQLTQRDMAEWGFEATVLAVGPDCAPELEPGVRVLLPQFAGIPLLDLETQVGIDLWIVTDGEVLAIVEDGAVPCACCGARVVVALTSRVVED